MDENKLLADFNSEIEQAFRSAWHSEKGGDENWNGVLSSYGLSPLADSDKQLLLNSEMKIARGAFPIELRRVYEKIIEKYNASVSSSRELSEVIKDFDIDAKVKEYYQKIKPFSGIVDIFKNAETGTGKYSSGMQKEKHHTLRCKNCGAPRLEEMQYDNCLFCGSKLFETT
jgi:hypothetical protein